MPSVLFPRVALQVLDELQPYTEAWAGLPLTPAVA